MELPGESYRVSDEVVGALADLHLLPVQHGELTLGLVTRPTADGEGSAWLESRSLRLLEAVEAVVGSVNLSLR